MGTFMAAYLAVWLAVVVYVGRLSLRQSRLHKSLDALQARLAEKSDNRESSSRAA